MSNPMTEAEALRELALALSEESMCRRYVEWRAENGFIQLEREVTRLTYLQAEVTRCRAALAQTQKGPDEQG